MAIGTITILLIVGYISLLRYFHVSEMPVERDLGLKSAVGPTPQIYIEPISIDALNDAMQMRVSFAPSGTLYGERLAPTERRLRLVITHDRAVEEIRVAPNDRPPTTTSEIDLSGGSVADYPLDSYRADLRVQLFEEAIPAVNEAKPLAAKVTMWKGSARFPPTIGRTLRLWPRRDQADYRNSPRWRLHSLRTCRLRGHGRAGLLRARDRINHLH